MRITTIILQVIAIISGSSSSSSPAPSSPSESHEPSMPSQRNLWDRPTSSLMNLDPGVQKLARSARCLAVRSRASARPSFLLSSSACRHRSGSSRRVLVSFGDCKTVRCRTTIEFMSSPRLQSFNQAQRLALERCTSTHCLVFKSL